MKDNIHQVQSDVRTAQKDLERAASSRVRSFTRKVQREARENVIKDPNTTTQLLRAIKKKNSKIGDEYQGSVWVQSGKAPYAPITEYGSGKRTNRTYSTSVVDSVNVGDQAPYDFPYDAPSVSVSFLAGVIAEWMEDKPVAPEQGSIGASAAAIAYTIVNKGTFAHPFMRPAYEAVYKDGFFATQSIRRLAHAVGAD